MQPERPGSTANTRPRVTWENPYTHVTPACTHARLTRRWARKGGSSIAQTTRSTPWMSGLTSSAESIFAVSVLKRTSELIAAIARAAASVL